MRAPFTRRARARFAFIGGTRPFLPRTTLHRKCKASLPIKQSHWEGRPGQAGQACWRDQEQWAARGWKRTSSNKKKVKRGLKWPSEGLMGTRWLWDPVGPVLPKGFRRLWEPVFCFSLSFCQQEVRRGKEGKANHKRRTLLARHWTPTTCVF